MRTLAEWLTLQEAVHPKSIDLELTRVAAVARALGIEAPEFPVITVAGTNGKGSVVAHLEALFGALGASTGMFTSPHLLKYNERIRLEGREAADSELIAAFERIEAARGATTLTFFEYNTLAALVIFADRAVDVALLEVGLGGRLDATNLVAADVAVLVSVGFDHSDWLGGTLDLIGAEKAGIFRAGRPAVLGTPEMPASVSAAIEALGARCGSPGASRWCRARWSGSSILHTTRLRPRCSRDSCASERCRAPSAGRGHGPSRSSECSRTRTPGESPRRSATSSITGSCARCPVRAAAAPGSSRSGSGGRGARSSSPTRSRRAASSRARRHGPETGSSSSDQSTPWGRRSNGFGYTKCEPAASAASVTLARRCTALGFRGFAPTVRGAK